MLKWAKLMLILQIIANDSDVARITESFVRSYHLMTFLNSCQVYVKEDQNHRPSITSTWTMWCTPVKSKTSNSWNWISESEQQQQPREEWRFCYRGDHILVRL